MRNRLAPLALCLWNVPALAQDPLSAIEWLTEQSLIVQPPLPTEPPVTHSANVPTVDVQTLDDSSVAAVGLLPSATTGLPATLWQTSSTRSLTGLINAMSVDDHPDLMRLFITLLLAEAEAPEDSGSGADLLRTRAEKLIAVGAVDPAAALLDRAGPEDPVLFPVWFELSLLTGDVATACESAASKPHLVTDPSARIFCAARAGDWTTAVTILQTSEAIGAIDARRADLLTRFLEPELAEEGFGFVPPTDPDPLEFRLYEAIGEPLPTASLPRQYAVIDLNGDAGWKAQIEAAERLARVGALQPNRLLGIYAERRAAASGGVWDRVRAVHALDQAISENDANAASAAVVTAWHLFEEEGLLAALAEMFGPSLRDLPMTGTAARYAAQLALLSPEYESAAKALPKGLLPGQEVLTAIATGTPGSVTASQAMPEAILAGFRATEAPSSLTGLLTQGRLGEAILRAMTLYSLGAQGNLQSLTDAIAALRFVGLEQTARRAALHLLITGQSQP
jgi:hypothetical protein